MKSRTTFKNIEDFLYQENKTFVIPNYQRGYKWAVKENDKAPSAVENLMDNLLSADKEQQYFLQGVTVVEEDDKVYMIDGQQRLTTLYLLLWCLSKELIKKINLDYDIREKSKQFINSLKDNNFDVENFDKENRNQDIFYFKKAIKQITAKLKSLGDELKQSFVHFLLNKVTILYIVIDKDKATKTFTMMNGSKASMLQVELVKAEMLRKISKPDTVEKEISYSVDDSLIDLKEIIAKDWETNAHRSRLAREWDKWLYWWNQEDVKDYFGVERPMGLLLEFYTWKNKKTDFSFEVFKNLLTPNNDTEKQKSKQIFKELRSLQKSFEDIFSIPRVHNYLKMSLICNSGNEDRFEIIDYFIRKKNDDEIVDDYAKWRLVGATHRQICKEYELKGNEETKEMKAEVALKSLSEKFVYNTAYDLALKQLLRLNVEEDNKLFNGKGRKFDFSIYGNKSLEHIHPKSKAYHKEEVEDKDNNKILVYKDGNGVDLGHTYPNGSDWLNRDEMHEGLSEHSVGNLLLLHKDENSKFSNSAFEDKKSIYFNLDEAFKSRNLLHTISVFAKSNWTKTEIENNQNVFFSRFKQDYNINEK